MNDKKSISSDDIGSSLTELYQRYAIAPERQDEVAQAVARIFEAAHAGEPLPVTTPVWKPLDPETTQWPTEKYDDARKSEDIVAFLRRVWKPLIEAGATRRDIRRQDPNADTAIANYTRRLPDGSRRKLPDDVYVPTLKEINDAQLSTAHVDILEGRRLSAAMYRRRLKAQAYNAG